MKKSNRLVFFGNERLATGVSTTAPTLRALIGAGYDVAVVVSHFEPGRSRNARELEIENVAKKHDIPLLLPEKPAEIAKKLQEIGAKAAVLVAYGKIVPESVIDIFPAGIVNIHPSLLPKHRGPTPIEQAMLDGADRTGVSLMRLAKKMDAGPVYAQEELPLQGTETKQQLADTLLEMGADMLIRHLPSILDGTLKTAEQDENKASYCQLLTKEVGQMKPDEFTAEELERQVRAYAGFPKSRLDTDDYSVVVTDAKVVSELPPKTLAVTCKEGTVLEILELIGPSGKTMSGQAFYNGYLKP